MFSSFGWAVRAENLQRESTIGVSDDTLAKLVNPNDWRPSFRLLKSWYYVGSYPVGTIGTYLTFGVVLPPQPPKLEVPGRLSATKPSGQQLVGRYSSKNTRERQSWALCELHLEALREKVKLGILFSFSKAPMLKFFAALLYA